MPSRSTPPSKDPGNWPAEEQTPPSAIFPAVLIQPPSPNNSLTTLNPNPYQAPINRGKTGATTFFAATFLLFIRFFKPILAGRFVWVVMTVVPSLALTGGLMFVHIRGSLWQMANGQWMAQGSGRRFRWLR